MNKSHCEKMTGCKVVKFGPLYELVNNDGDVIFISNNKKERHAYKELHDKYYNMMRFLVFERDEYKCVRCGSGSNLQCHHKKYRSQGGTHMIENNETLCWICHDKEHRCTK